MPTSDAYLDSASNHFLAWRVDGGPAGDEARSIYVAYNGSPSKVEAYLPPAAPGYGWYRSLDTSDWFEPKNNMYPVGAETFYDHPTYGLGRRARDRSEKPARPSLRAEAYCTYAERPSTAVRAEREEDRDLRVESW